MGSGRTDEFLSRSRKMKKQDQDFPLETLSVRVTGKVQGVGYRASAVRQAHMLGIGGWVRNASDGSVEALLQGNPDAIDRMLQWMRQGPPAARVTDVLHETIRDERRYDRFEQH